MIHCRIVLLTILALLFITGCKGEIQSRSIGSDSDSIGNQTQNPPSNEEESDNSNDNNESEESESETETERIPMFVAVGRGGRTMISCDDGRTWIADRFIEDNNADHSETVDKGFVYGDGIFMQKLGWGADNSIQRSEDGINWERVPIPRGLGSLAFTGDAFLTFGPKSAISKDGGFTWEERTQPEHGFPLREGGGGGEPGGPSIVVGGAEDTPTFTTDEGETWQKAPSKCSDVDGFGGVGHRGGFAFGKKTMVIVDSEGEFCTSSDYGQTWTAGQIATYRNGPISNVGKTFYAAPYFWATVGNRIHRSLDGINWDSFDVKPSGTYIHAIAVSEKGTYVGFDRIKSEFYRSQNGIDWSSVSIHRETPTFQRIVFGYGLPSESCN